MRERSDVDRGDVSEGEGGAGILALRASTYVLEAYHLVAERMRNLC